jgi:hypothetical protein
MEGEEDGVTGLRRYGGTGIKTDGQARGWKRESFTHMPLKKVTSYVHAIKKFLITYMPCTQNSLTHMPFWMDSVRT